MKGTASKWLNDSLCKASLKIVTRSWLKRAIVERAATKIFIPNVTCDSVMELKNFTSVFHPKILFRLEIISVAIVLEDLSASGVGFSVMDGD